MTALDVVRDPDQAVEQAVSRLHKGDLEGARDICRRLLAAHPDHVGGLQVVAWDAMRDSRVDEAIVHFGRLARIDPQPHVYSNLAECFWRKGRLFEALDAVDAALALEPSRFDGHIVRAAVLHGLGRYEESLAAALEAQRLDPNSHVACARVGASMAQMGLLDEAEQQFVNATRLSSGAKPYPGVSFDRALHERLATPRPREILQVLERGADRVSAARFVVLVCSDSGYLLKYGFNFVNSFERNASGGKLLHLHVVDPEKESMAMLEKIRKELRPVSLAVTVSASPPGVRGGVRRNVYYSCSRFLLLPQLLAQYAVPIVCIDVDAIVENSLDGAVDWASRFDVALARREPLHSPWLDISAGLVVANPSVASGSYFERVRNYLLDFMERDAMPWHVDQAALYCVLRMMERYDVAPKVGWLPQSARDCVWQMGHSYERNLFDARFTRYSSSAGMGL